MVAEIIINIVILILTVIAVLGFIVIIYAMANFGKGEKIEGYHAEASDSQGGVLWVSDTDPNDSFWG